VTDDIIIAHFVAYTDKSDIDIDYSGDDPTIENHDELVNAGQTYDEIRALRRTENTEKYVTEDMIVEPGDPMWRKECADMEPGDAIRVNEPDDGTPMVS